MSKKLFYSATFMFVLGLVLPSVIRAADPSLVGWWKFEEASGTLFDQSDNHNDSTSYSGTLYQQAGHVGYALGFDGIDDIVVVGSTGRPTDTFSFGGWLKTSATHEIDGESSSGTVGTAGQRYAFDPQHGGDLNAGAGLSIGTNGIAVYEHGSNYMPATATYPTNLGNDWNHIMIVYENKQPTIYLNGSAVRTGFISPREIVSAPIQFGGMAYGYYEGLMDEVRIYDRALSAAEIKKLAARPKAHDPSPEDGALLTNFPGGKLGSSLSWKPGYFAVSHNVYFGDNFDAVNNGTGGTSQGNQTAMYFLVGYGYTPNDPLPGGFVPGTTYYWRIDEVNDLDPNSPWKGDVWSFSLPPYKAYEPTPINGGAFVDPNVGLSWELGFGGVMQTVYLGVDYDTINDATTGGTSVGGMKTYDPGTLEFDTLYYWRVDTAGVYGQFKGEVWNFKTTLPGLGTIVHERWDGISSVPELRNHWKFPNNPDTVEILNQFSWDLDFEGYAARIYGWLYVPATGDYTFWLCSDDNGELWLSTDDDPSNIELIAQESTWQNPNVWGSGEEQSEPIPLVGGNIYYIEALWQEGTGGDHCMVAWKGPAVPTRVIIPGTNLSPYRPLKAYGARPTNGAVGVTQAPVLQWKSGIQAASHELYFGTDEDAVSNATKTSPEYIGPIALGSESYDPGKLTWESTYYWRVDEVNNTNPDSPWVGSVWSFTTAGFAIVDDFEDYNVTDKQIWAIWHDGIGYWDLDGVFHPGNNTGSGVGDEDNDVTYMEQSIVHGGGISMPYFFNNNDPAKAKYSEAKKTLVNTRDWTEEGVKALSLWFQGYAASVGSFTDNLDGTYTMTASGADIWDIEDFPGSGDGFYHDEFHFAHKPLTGAGSIIARVDSVQNTDPWAKAGVMIRESLDANSVHAMVVVTPGSGVSFQNRPSTGGASSDTTVTGITAPQWVRLSRDISGFFTASYSSNGQNWTQIGVPENIPMNANAFVGLAVTAHNATATCQAEFSNVQVSVSGPWSNQDIGILSNDPERIYVSIANSNGTTGTVYYEDNDNIVTDATQLGTWTEFNIDLKDFQDQGVNLTDVNSVTIGIGTRGGTTPGGAGKMYFDDIRLYRPRCVPEKVILSQADFDSNCVVDFRDLETLAADWLANDSGLAVDLNTDSTVDFKDYAVLVDQWLEERLWPE